MRVGGKRFGVGLGTIAILLLLLASPPASPLASQGIDVTPTVDGLPIDSGPLALEAGRTVSLGVRISDQGSGFPLGDLHPAFWVRPATPGRDACAAAIDRYLSLGPNAGIDDDLNGYLFATLNADHSIGVMDPKLNLATSNLLSLTPRDRSADAWWLDQTGARLFIASADGAKLEVIDLLSGDLTEAVGDLDGAGSIAVFPSLDRLWVAGETQIKGLALEQQQPIHVTDLPAGAWQLASDHVGLRLLALDRQAGRFLIVHPENGMIEKEITLGGKRGMFVHDVVADAVYILSDHGAALDRLFLDEKRPSNHPLPVAVDQLLLTDDGDWLAALNSANGSLVLIDAASLQPVHVLQFDGKPAQMQASEHYLYLLESGTGYASLVHLPSLNSEQSPGVLRIPIGPATAGGVDESETLRLAGSSTPSAIASLVEGGGAIIASASDKNLYLYMETGMQAPANAFKSWTAAPKAVALLDRRPTEYQAGLYETAYRPKTAGAFELVFYLPNPKTVRCFDVAVSGNGPELAATLRPPRLRWIRPEAPIIAGEPVELRFQLDQAVNDDAAAGRQATEVLAMATGRNWHWRGRATPIEDDRFVLTMVLPEPGSYQLLVRAPTRHLDFMDQQPHSINVVAAR
ncbi:MAG: hypothetical protein OEU92_02515 [Alphaproteobacteria bacterium]|nr:hypothetical protein [Alphaproteobacteria bacterium]